MIGRLAAAVLVVVLLWFPHPAVRSASQGLAGLADAPDAPAPQRIVSLVPSVTEILFAIEAGPQVVAVSTFETHPPEALTLPRAGGLVDPNIERILTLRPDLVITYGSQDTLRAKLTSVGIPVVEYRHAGLAEIGETIRALGERTGHAAAADRVARGLEAELEDVRRRVAGRPKPRTLLLFNRDLPSLKQMYASGGRGFLHDLLELTGAANVFADLRQESVQVSHEQVLARAPEVILEIRSKRPPDLERARAPWRVLGAVPAVASNRIVFLDGPTAVPGPRIGRAARAMARAIHPGAFD